MAAMQINVLNNQIMAQSNCLAYGTTSVEEQPQQTLPADARADSHAMARAVLEWWAIHRGDAVDLLTDYEREDAFLLYEEEPIFVAMARKLLPDFVAAPVATPPDPHLVIDRLLASVQERFEFPGYAETYFSAWSREIDADNSCYASCSVFAGYGDGRPVDSLTLVAYVEHGAIRESYCVDSKGQLTQHGFGL